MEDLRWDNSAHEALSNGPFRTVTAPLMPKYAPDSDRREIEYPFPYPFHAVDPNPWPPISFDWNGIPITVYRPLGAITSHDTSVQTGNEQADAYCTVIRLSTPPTFQLSTDDGWRIIKRLLEWIRVKGRHYWLLHGNAGFGAAYRGTLFVREGRQISYQNVALYGPNVIVNPLSSELWSSMAFELQTNAELPLADSIYCDSLLSIVAGDILKALLEAGVAMEVALTRLLVDVSTSMPASSAKASFIRKDGDRHAFGKKLGEWTKNLGLEPVESFTFKGAPPKWHATALELYKLRNGVAHAGQVGTSGTFHEVVNAMFSAGALLEYCRSQRKRLGLPVFSMPANTSPWQHVRLCHDGHISIASELKTAPLA
jgi:hypothetical protein